LGGGHCSRRPQGRDAPVARTAFLAAWKDLTETAKRFRCELTVQREAIGVWRHENVERHHLIPTIPFSLTSTDAEEAL